MQDRKRLQKLIKQSFNLRELRELADDLHVEWEEIAGETLTDKTRNLLTYLERRKRIPFLLETVQEERPKVNWLETATDTTPSPYRGLKAFRLEDEPLFFGREALTSHLVAVAKEQSFIPVLGPSGSGKSSVVMAGLLPQLLRQGNWLLASFRPGAKPFQALMRALLRLLFPDNVAQQTKELKQWLTLLREKEVSLQDVIERILDDHDPGTKILIVADQFEELYTLCQDRKLRHNFLDQLLELIDATREAAQPTNLFLLTLRSDFLGQAQNDYMAFTRALHSGHMVLMEPMDRSGLREAIKYPALNAGVGFERHLVERIVDDIAEEPGQLPLLEFALDLLWEKRANNAITLAAYEEIGRVAGALAQYADQQYEALTAAEQEQARQIFLKLVQPGEGTQDTRRLAKRVEVGKESWPLVVKLASQRLLVTNRNANSEETVEMIHEALIWGWRRLQEWVDTDRIFLIQLK
ncbi:MAG: AAA family ATPase [Chloroflexota bacterium]